MNNVLLRKVVKAHGTGKLIEGVYKEGQKCLVVEDVMVSGQGIYEACQVSAIFILKPCELFIVFYLLSDLIYTFDCILIDKIK